jgi:GTP-binding protein
MNETVEHYIVNHAALAATAVRKGQFPGDGLPEVAFAGKSNVGKSSLINAMLGRKSLARSSQNPGKTRTLNFYAVTAPLAPNIRQKTVETVVSEQNIYFVDLPGYGYAKVSRNESAKWGAMVEGYLINREPLKLLLLLLDIRHEPGTHDRQLYEWCIHHRFPLLTVATKSDKLKKSRVQKHLAMLRHALGAETAPLLFSSETREGRDALWAIILDKCGLAVLQ